MTGIISFKDMMARLWQGEEMDITVVTLSLARKEGGNIKEYKGARLNITKEKENRAPVGDKREDIQLLPTVFYRPKPTINIILKNNEIRTIYKVGIIKCNQLNVVI